MKYTALLIAMILICTSCTNRNSYIPHIPDHYEYPDVIINQKIIPQGKVLLLITDESYKFVRTLKKPPGNNSRGWKSSTWNPNRNATLAAVAVILVIGGIFILAKKAADRRRKKRMWRMLQKSNPALITAKNIRRIMRTSGVQYRFSRFPDIKNSRFRLIDTKQKMESDRNFGALNGKTDAQYILELRITDFHITRYGKRGTHSLNIGMKGILHDRILRRKIWEANSRTMRLLPENLRILTRERSPLLDRHIREGIFQTIRKLAGTLKTN